MIFPIPQKNRPACPPPVRPAGFTLIELMVVIAIAMLLVTFSITAYFGATKEIAKTKARSHIRDVLTQTKQRACLEGVTYGVYCFTMRDRSVDGDDIYTPVYAAVRQLGEFTVGDFTGENPTDHEYSNKYDLWDLSGSFAEQFTIVEEGAVVAQEYAQIFNLSSGTLSKGKVQLYPKDFRNAKKELAETKVPFKQVKASMKFPNGTVTSAGLNYGLKTTLMLEKAHDKTYPVQLVLRASNDYFFPSGYTYPRNDTEQLFVFYPDGTAEEKSLVVTRGTSGGDQFTVRVSKPGVISIN